MRYIYYNYCKNHTELRISFSLSVCFCLNFGISVTREIQMTGKRVCVLALSIALLLSFFSGLNAFAAMSYETQYVYDQADPAWLREIIIKEDMRTVTGLTKRCEIKAKSTYPYTENADTFREKIEKVYQLYVLDEDMVNVLYHYVLDAGNQIAKNTAASEYSDEYIKAYLISSGIVWPENGDTEENRIIARALFALMTAQEPYKVARGTKLTDAFTAYVSKLAGVDVKALTRFDPDGSMGNVREYVVAMCKYGLYRAGYDVDLNTDEGEVARLIAVMTIKEAGITIDAKNATNQEIRDKYVCAAVCKVYDVQPDYQAFTAAVRRRELPKYMLQLLGKKHGLAIADGEKYEDAFERVRDNTHEFDLEAGEFYADVYEYDVQLENRRSSIWVYPEALFYDSNGTVTMKIGSQELRHRYYNEVAVDPDSDTDRIEITVTSKQAPNHKIVYRINVYQGQEEAVVSDKLSGALTGVSGTVTQVLSEMRPNSDLSRIVTTIPFALPERVLSISDLMLPNTATGTGGNSFLTKFFGYARDNDSRVNTTTIGGVGGLDAYTATGATPSALSVNFTSAAQPGYDVITANTPAVFAAPTAPPAEAAVIEEPVQSPVTAPAAQAQENGGSLDVRTIIVVACALAATFAVCLVLFNKIIRLKAENGEIDFTAGSAAREETSSRSKGRKTADRYRKQRGQGPVVIGDTVPERKKRPQSRPSKAQTPAEEPEIPRLTRFHDD